MKLPQSFYQEAKKYRRIHNIFFYLSIISLIGIYASLFLLFNNFWLMIIGILTGLAGVVTFFLLSLRFLDKALQAEQNSRALIEYLVKNQK